MKRLVQVFMIFLVLLFGAVPAFASNITIWDGIGPQGSGKGGENNEVEPNMTPSQVWDLEGFFLDNHSLSVVGGYNFVSGEYSNSANPNFMSGDIFISTSSVTPNPTGSKPYGYNYVLDLDFSDADALTYSVYALNSASTLRDPFFPQNENSSPWQYDHASEVAVTYKGVILGGLSFAFSPVASDSEFNVFEDYYSGSAVDTHYALTGFDLSFLGHGTKFYSHFTMECGNDNLMGQGTVVPEPTTMILLGSGLVGLALYRRKKK